MFRFPSPTCPPPSDLAPSFGHEPLIAACQMPSTQHPRGPYYPGIPVPDYGAKSAIEARFGSRRTSRIHWEPFAVARAPKQPSLSGTSKTHRGLLWSQLVCAAAKVCTKKQIDGLLNHRQPYRRPHVTAMVQLQFGIKEQEPCSWPCVCDDLHSVNPVSSSLVEFRFSTRWIFAGKRMRSGS